MIKTYDEALSFIHGRTQFKKIPTLTRMKRFLAELGNPQKDLITFTLQELMVRDQPLQ